MDSFMLALSVVSPLFLLMAFGYFLKAIHLFDDPFLKQLNKVIFKVFMPVLLFSNLYDIDFRAEFDGKLIAFAASSILVAFFLLFLLVPRFTKDNRKRGVIIQGIIRSNYVLFGLPVVQSICGDDSRGITSMLIAVVVPLFNLLSVVALQTFAEGKVSLKKTCLEIAKNPLILAAATAFLFFLLNIRLPQLIVKPLTDVAGITTPLALIVLGGSFDIKKVGSNKKPLFATVVCKLIVMPAIFLPVAVALGYRGAPLAAFMTIFGAPVAVSSFPMAQQMGGDGELAGEIVVFTSLCSIVSIFLLVTVLRSLGLF